MVDTPSLSLLPLDDPRWKEYRGGYNFEPVMACLAISLDHRKHARVYLDLTETEISEFNKYYDGAAE